MTGKDPMPVNITFYQQEKVVERRILPNNEAVLLTHNGIIDAKTETDWRGQFMIRFTFIECCY